METLELKVGFLEARGEQHDQQIQRLLIKRQESDFEKDAGLFLRFVEFTAKNWKPMMWVLFIGASAFAAIYNFIVTHVLHKIPVIPVPH